MGCQSERMFRQPAEPQGGEDWITFFEHWREETTMAAIDHPPIREALSHIRALSADADSLIADFQERSLPHLAPREAVLPALPCQIDRVIGMP